MHAIDVMSSYYSLLVMVQNSTRHDLSIAVNSGNLVILVRGAMECVGEISSHPMLILQKHLGTGLGRVVDWWKILMKQQHVNVTISLAFVSCW